jgi:hypothetical protein
MVDELVNWLEGTYEFASADEKALPTHGLAIHLNPEELVLESMRRADELTTMQESMLAPDIMLARVKSAPREPLPRECTIVLKRVDGTKTIHELCRSSPLGDFLTYEAITELLGRQQIMVLDPKDTRRIAPAHKPRTRVSWSALTAILALVLGSMLLGAGLEPLLVKSAQYSGWFSEDVSQRRTEVREALRTDVEHLRKTLE